MDGLIHIREDRESKLQQKDLLDQYGNDITIWSIIGGNCD